MDPLMTPLHEAERLELLRALEILDTAPEPEFDALVQAAALVCGVPISLVSLVDAERQWFKANLGLHEVTQTSRQVAFCSYAILGDTLLEVPDATADARFADNPLVTGDPNIRFYAGMPLVLADGCSAGTLCVIDRQPRHLNDMQRAVLRHLAKVAVKAMEMRRLAHGFAASELQRLQQQQALENARDRMAMATDAGGIGVWECDLDSGEVTWDAWMHRLYGKSSAGVGETYASWLDRVHPDDRSLAARAAQATLAGDGAQRTEFRVIWPDGSLHHIGAAARVTRDAEGKALSAVGVNWDMTPLRTTTAALAQQLELMRVTLQSIADGVITTDQQGYVTWLNPVAERLTGWSGSEAMGRPLSQVFYLQKADTRVATESPVMACLKSGQAVATGGPSMLLSRQGKEYLIEDTAAPIRNDQSELLGAVLVFRDVTEQRRLSGEMTYRASHDDLTGLVNRAEFEARLQRTLNKAHDEHSVHALLYIDLDQFKLVNDACGHAVGDQLLKQAAALLKETVRARDTVARLGGDEFVVILEHCPIANAELVAQKFCNRMDEFRFTHADRRFRIGASIGLVPLDARWSSTTAVMQAADTSCYAAKEGGRNRVHTWFDTDQVMRDRQGELHWASRLEQALDEDRFVLYGQRIKALTGTDNGLHLEVLIRMVDTDGKLVPPGYFLPAAERFNLSSRLDRWVLRHCVFAMRELSRAEDVSMMCINVSGQSVGDRVFHRYAIDALTAAGPAVCRRLCLEITETAAVTRMADAAVFVDQVRALGVRVALDDFGAGASSFGYLKSLKVDILKIDGQFIKDIIVDPLDDAAVRCFVDVARVVGVRTVAEFVDNPAVLQRVRDIGVDFAQGFMLHKPEPLQQLLGALTAPEPAPEPAALTNKVSALTLP